MLEKYPLVAVSEPQNALQHNSFTKVALRGSGLLLGVLAGTGIANTIAPTHDHIGPVDISVRLQPSSTVNIDGGIFPGLRHNSPLHVIGARVSIDSLGIKAAAVDTTAGTPTSGSKSMDYGTYLQSFNDVSHDISRTATHAAIRSGEWGAAGMATAGAALWLLPVYRRRLDRRNPEVSAAVSTISTHYRHYRYLVPAMVTIAGLSSCTAYDVPNFQSVVANTNFRGTALDGWQLTGELAPAAEQAINYAERTISANDAYYKQPVKQLKQQFTASYDAALPTGKDIARVVTISDVHCHTGMTPVIAEVAHLFSADVVADNGDADVSGTSQIEVLCTQGLAQRLHELHIPQVAALGNHDSSLVTDPSQGFTTKQWEEAQGIQVLDIPDKSIKDTSQPVLTLQTKHGTLTFASIRDGRRSRFGHKIEPVSLADQTDLLTAEGKRLGAIICKQDKPIDILITHDERVAGQAIQSGCGKISYTSSGHIHHRILPEISGYTLKGQPIYSYTEGTSGGAGDTPSYGPLQETASLSVNFMNTKTHQFLGATYLDIQPTPDADLTMSRFIAAPYIDTREPLSAHLPN